MAARMRLGWILVDWVIFWDALPEASSRQNFTPFKYPKVVREFNFRRRKEADAGRYQRGSGAARDLSPTLRGRTAT